MILLEALEGAELHMMEVAGFSGKPASTSASAIAAFLLAGTLATSVAGCPTSSGRSRFLRVLAVLCLTDLLAAEQYLYGGAACVNVT